MLYLSVDGEMLFIRILFKLKVLTLGDGNRKIQRAFNKID
jgi:hypothetical protein